VNAPNQSFVCNIKLANRTLNMGFSLSYNVVAGYWRCSLSDPSTGIDYVTNMPLVCGENLLAQFEHLNIGSMWILKVGNVPNDSPDDTNLGTEFIMVWDE
jgi:hypothetical protein